VKQESNTSAWKGKGRAIPVGMVASHKVSDVPLPSDSLAQSILPSHIAETNVFVKGISENNTDGLPSEDGAQGPPTSHEPAKDGSLQDPQTEKQDDPAMVTDKRGDQENAASSSNCPRKRQRSVGDEGNSRI
jgi:hypothetical protein